MFEELNKIHTEIETLKCKFAEETEKVLKQALKEANLSIGDKVKHLETNEVGILGSVFVSDTRTDIHARIFKIRKDGTMSTHRIYCPNKLKYFVKNEE